MMVRPSKTSRSADIDIGVGYVAVGFKQLEDHGAKFNEHEYSGACCLRVVSAVCVVCVVCVVRRCATIRTCSTCSAGGVRCERVPAGHARKSTRKHT